MRKLRTSVLALTTVASLALGGTAVATAEEAPQSSTQDNKGSLDKLKDKAQGSSNKNEVGEKGSSKNNSSSTKKDDESTDSKGSVNPKRGWVPGHSFGSTLQTDYVPVWAKIWMAVVAVVGIVTVGLFSAPAITALRAHHIIP